jgi:hypothetical protein
MARRPAVGSRQWWLVLAGWWVLGMVVILIAHGVGWI